MRISYPFTGERLDNGATTILLHHTPCNAQLNPLKCEKRTASFRKCTASFSNPTASFPGLIDLSDLGDRPCDSQALRWSDLGDRPCDSQALRWACLQYPPKLKPFSAWVSYFPSKGLKIPLGRSQKSLSRVSKIPSIGLKIPLLGQRSVPVRGAIRRACPRRIPAIGISTFRFLCHLEIIVRTKSILRPPEHEWWDWGLIFP